MVAAKLDHSGVLVTKFHQNRSTLKGTSASQRHTHRETWLKIMALQVCIRANRMYANVDEVFSHSAAANIIDLSKVSMYVMKITVRVHYCLNVEGAIKS